MIHAKFRLWLRSARRLEELWQLLAVDIALAKEFFRVERKEYLSKLLELQGNVPVTAENVVFISNRFFMRNAQLLAMEPHPLKAVMDRWKAQRSHSFPEAQVCHSTP